MRSPPRPPHPPSRRRRRPRRHAAKKAERAADRAFAKKVRQAIVRAPGVGHAQVTVFANAKTGDVTLAGQITDESQDRAAVDAARRVPGVTSVKSRLQLRLEGGQ